MVGLAAGFVIFVTKVTASMDADQRTHSMPSPRSHGSDRARRLSRIFVPIIVGALILFSFLNVYLGLHKETLPETIEGAVFYTDLSNDVVDGPIDYDVEPPPGGPHAAVVQECGLYRVPVHNENTVASLATGAVWISYDESLPKTDVDNLWSFAENHLHVILAPYPGLKAPVVLTAWGVQVAVDSTLDLRIPAFIQDYADGDDVPNPDSTCREGVSIP